MKKRTFLTGAALALALMLTACNSKSVSMDITPDPVVVGLVDTSVTVHMHVDARGYGGTVPFDQVQFAAFDGSDKLLVSKTEKIDTSNQATVMDRDFTIPVVGALVALSGAKYVMVKLLDPQGHELAARKVTVVVHALQGIPLPNLVQPQPTP